MKKQKNKHINTLKKDDCVYCGGRCSHGNDLPLYMLRCEKCGRLKANPNYNLTFIGG